MFQLKKEGARFAVHSESTYLLCTIAKFSFEETVRQSRSVTWKYCSTITVSVDAVEWACPVIYMSGCRDWRPKQLIAGWSRFSFR